MMPPEHMHKQFKCDRKAGWGASIIVHERFANRVTFNTHGTNWVVIGLDFSDMGWKDMGFVSGHLPPTKKKRRWMMLNIEEPLQKSMLQFLS